ncbi:MAG: 1-acyl-sn-glycerol-3-phosphate acyltransferase [Spirochaetes bacterium]|nr:1-acyl-sn-glycerol-3-phosphate acyltransferase [Spirochaetota bacterium]
MILLKKIFWFIFSIFLWIYWWTIAVIFIPLIIIISYFIPKKYHNNIVVFLCRLLTYSIFFIPKLIYKENKELPYPVIYVANHVSFFDLFISGSVLPGNPRGMESVDHFKKPFYGWFLKRFDQIPIDLGNRKSIINSFNKIIEILKNKKRNILIMPEGHRTIDGKVGDFKTGAFYLSRKSNIPVVPVVYKGLFERANKSIFLKPGKFDVIIYPPVYPENFTNDDQMGIYIKNIINDELNNK